MTSSSAFQTRSHNSGKRRHSGISGLGQLKQLQLDPVLQLHQLLLQSRHQQEMLLWTKRSRLRQANKCNGFLSSTTPLVRII
ncbi:hypothetical protein BIW11_05964 [Tropilaelaps mercedesae]|uniref:Uncharacterized protein n=1 Tax=Tropilaelaps mercedesae TaxID=418985 RepID=A0A1V9Y063_9ACAR|nr:hypothetical protein BIW11_05964 [Tropilaelaps mercedesae]